MKRNPDILYNAEALMHLAEFLHNALLWRGRTPFNVPPHKKNTNIDKRFEKIMERMRKSVDYRAKSAQKLLKCKITSMTLPYGTGAVCINMSAAPKKREKNRITQKQ